MNTKLVLKTMPVLISLILSGCGGGGGGGTASSTTPNQAATLSGTAATGAPVQGKVFVKDSAGATRVAIISPNGQFTLDVSGMTAPLMLKVEGTAGGRSQTLYSAATSADMNGTVNVTPLTTLILANAAGRVPDDLFLNGQFQNVFTAAKINDAETVLKARLKPVLNAVGVPDSEDLMNGKFSADHTGMDAALDSIKVNVSVDANSGKPIARIEEIYGNNYIDDDLSSEADQSTIQVPADMQAGLQALKDVIAQFQTLQAKFAAGVPSVNDSAFSDLFDSSFKSGGVDKAGFMNAWTASTGMRGVEFEQITPLDIDLTAGTAHVAFKTEFDDDRSEQSIWELRKGSDGKWRFAGDQQVTPVDVEAQSQLDANSQAISAGLDLSIKRPVDPSVKVDYVKVTGPGLPTQGVLLVNYAGSDSFSISGKAAYDGTTPGTDAANVGKTFQLLGDASIAAIPDNSTYNVKLYNDAGTPTTAGDDQLIGSYALVLPKRPYATSQLQVANFPAIGMDALTQIQSYTGGSNPVNFSWAMPEDLRSSGVRSIQADNTGATTSTQYSLVPGSSSFSVQYPSGAFTMKALYLEGQDEYGRKRVNVYTFPVSSTAGSSTSPTAPMTSGA